VDLTKLYGNEKLYREVKEYNLIEKLEQLLKARVFHFGAEDGKLTSNISHVWETPWITVHRDNDRECMLWHQILFKFMDVIPSFCLNCWKVVVRPNTLDEVFQLHDMMLGWNRSSKIGIEVRAYVQSLYGAYFYNNSLEEGNECLEFVKEQVHSKINPEIDVHLKRYCTEFELRHGDSDKYKQRPEDLIWEKIVHDSFALQDMPLLQPQPHPAIIKQHIIQKIIEYATKMKDPTVPKYNEGKVPMPDIVKYDRTSRDPNLKADQEEDGHKTDK